MLIKKPDVINEQLLNFIVPVSGIEFQKNKIFMGENYYKVFTIIDYPMNIQIGWLAKLLSNLGIFASIHIEPVDNSMLLQAVNSRIRQARGLAKTAKDEVEKQRKELEIEEAKNMITEIDQNNEVISYMTIYVMVFSQELKELEEKCKTVRRIASMLKLKLRPMTNFSIKDGFKAISPFEITDENVNYNFRQNIFMNDLTGSYLFNTNALIEEKGYLIGKTDVGGLVIPDFWKRGQDVVNGNIAIFGESGVGKSTTIKKIFINESITSKILLIDPQGEYVDMAKQMNGNVFDCSGLKKNEGIINPLQIRVSDSENNINYLTKHLQFLQSFFNILFPTLNEIQISLLDEVLEELYKSFDIDETTEIDKLENDDFPILEDLYDLIEEKYNNTKKADYEVLLSIIRPISIGQFKSIWNGYTNVNSKNDITVFDTSNLQGFSILYKRAQYYNILSYIWEIVTRDVKEKVCVIAEECHILLSKDVTQTAEFLKYIIATIRKYNGIALVATQTVGDFMNNDMKIYGQSIISNCGNKFIFRSNYKDISDLQEICGFSQSEKEILKNATKGECIFISGNKRIHTKIILLEMEKEIIKDSGGR